MKERPILFSAPMVRAILEGRKTVTRRVVKPQPLEGYNRAAWYSPGVMGWTADPVPGGLWQQVRCPYGQPGDRLWVRETCMRVPHPSELGLTREDIPITWDQCCAIADMFIYRADHGSDLIADGRRWTPSIHMPRLASRITLEFTGGRVERLQNVSEADARAEGVRQMTDGSGCWVSREGPGKLVTPWLSARDAFRDLWETINGAGSWDANPWVWVVEFKLREIDRP